MPIRTALLVLAALACATVSLAQTSSAPGELRGRVLDPAGLGIPGAIVSVASADSGAARAGITRQDGAFTFAGLPPGTYQVRAESGGFTPVQRDAVPVTAGNISEVTIGLTPRPYGETVVVTGSRKEEMVRYAPAAITVLGAEEIQSAGVQNYADILRRAPGVNVIQFSARDVQFTARGSTSQASNKTLALVDGRPAYQPYYGMIVWDLLGIDFDEIKQIEVLRGPGSALWGTNALTGVVNIITRDPGEDAGTHVRVAGGSLGTADVALRHAGLRGRLGYKVSASFFRQDAWDRPLALPDGTPLPEFVNQGTDRKSVSTRVDFQQDTTTHWRVDAGFATTGGGIMTPLGPQEARPMRQGFGRVQFQRGRTRVGASFDAHYAKAASLLSEDVATFEYQSGQIEAEHSIVRPRFVVTLAGSGRIHHFDINVTPNQHTRQELGVVADSDIFVTEHVRLRAGGRLDWFSSFGSTVSPRIGVVVEPVPGHTFRAAYNRAYVAPSFLENHLFFPTATVIGLPTGPYLLPFVAAGNADLDPLKDEAYEVGYTAVLSPRATFTLSVYRNKTAGEVALVPTEFYSVASPPEGWPLPAEAIALAPPLPKVLTQQNLGEVVDAGVETSLDVRWTRGIESFVNYSFQRTPDATDVPILINVPPRHRLNAGITASRGRTFGSISISTASRAFWADVQPYTGYTARYSLVNFTAGVRFTLQRANGTLAIKVINAGDSEIRQHIFGDLLRRRSTAELRFSF